MKKILLFFILCSSSLQIQAQKYPEFYGSIKLGMYSQFYFEPKLYSDGTIISSHSLSDTTEHFFIPMPLIGIHFPVYKSFGIKAGFGFQQLNYDLLLSMATQTPDVFLDTRAKFRTNNTITEILLCFTSREFDTYNYFSDNHFTERFRAEIGIQIFRRVSNTTFSFEPSPELSQSQNNFITTFSNQIRNPLYALHFGLYGGINRFDIGFNVNLMFNEMKELGYFGVSNQSHNTFRYFIGISGTYYIPFNE